MNDETSNARYANKQAINQSNKHVHQIGPKYLPYLVESLTDHICRVIVYHNDAPGYELDSVRYCFVYLRY